MKYLVYYRVSTKQQGESGLGLEAQKAIISHFLPDEMIAGEYVEVISAKVAPADRPQLAAALAECEEKGYGLAVAKVDRLSRVTEDALAVYSRLGGFIYAADIPMQPGAQMDKFTLTIYMAIADRERELIGIRTKAALTEKISRFLKSVGQSAYNYFNASKEAQKETRQRYAAEWPLGSPDNLTAEDKAKGLSVRQQNAQTAAAWVKTAEYAEMLRDKGLSLQAIADKLNAKGFTTRRGKAFQRTTVNRLLEKAAA